MSSILTPGGISLGKEQNSGTHLAELEELSKPLVTWLREHYNPHYEIVISWDMAKVMGGNTSVPFSYEN